MPKDLCLNMEIPFPFGAELIFHKWLPSGKEEGLALEKDGIHVRIWVDPTCTWLSRDEMQQIEHHIGIAVTKIHTDVVIKQVPDELVDFIYDEKDRPEMGPKKDPDENYTLLRNAYTHLGERTLKVTIEAFNKLMSYARNEKGQYWLMRRVPDVDTMASAFTEFRAKVCANQRGWIRWYPTQVERITVTGRDTSKFIAGSDWRHITEFVRTTRRADLVLELLANAESLAHEGYRRSAVIEGVTALEVAVGRFSKAMRRSGRWSRNLADRVDVASLSTQVEHLGFSGSVRYLFPLIFDEKELPIKVLKQCWQAVDIRQSVVHHGQRDVDDAIVGPLLRAIREMCSILKKHSEHSDR